ncbi:unnamed protein product, partial [Leptidea sinapis]
QIHKISVFYLSCTEQRLSGQLVHYKSVA